MLNTKSIRVAILSCEELERREMNKKLKDLQYQTCKAANRIIRMAYLRELEKIDCKNTNGKYPDDKEQYGMSFRNHLYHSVKEQMTLANSGNISQTVGNVLSKFASDRKKILNYQMSLPSYKLDMPIFIANQSYKIQKGHKGFEIATGVFNKAQDITLLTFRLDKLDGNKKATLEKIMNGVYKQGGGQITQDKKGKWYFNISFSFVSEAGILDINRILGLDLGINNAIAMQVWDDKNKSWERLNWKECLVDGHELIHFRQKLESRRRYLQRASKITGEGRIGHGRQKKTQLTSLAAEKIKNYRNTVNNKYSKYVVDMAVKYNCGVIQMENLEGIYNSENCFLRNWTYYDLQNKITYKAVEKGITVVKIEPKYTSQRCSQCGNIDSENRTKQEKFQCIVCGYEDNADINAAKNISLPNIEEIIREYAR